MTTMYGKITIKVKQNLYEVLHVQTYKCSICGQQMTVHGGRIKCEQCEKEYKEQCNIKIKAAKSGKCPECGDELQYATEEGYWSCSCGTVKTFRTFDPGEDPDERYGDAYATAGWYTGIVEPPKPLYTHLPDSKGQIAEYFIGPSEFKRYPEGYVHRSKYSKFIVDQLSPDNLYDLGGKRVVEYYIGGEKRKYTAWTLKPVTIEQAKRWFERVYTSLEFEFV